MAWNKQSSLLLQITIFFSITLSSVILLAANTLKQFLLLIGKANLKQDENTFVGHEIHYDLVTGELKAISGKENNKRVKIIWNSDDGVGKH